MKPPVNQSAAPVLRPLLERLRMNAFRDTVDQVDTVYHPADPLEALVEEAANEIERLRTALNAVRQTYLNPGASWVVARDDLSRIVCEALKDV